MDHGVGGGVAVRLLPAVVAGSHQPLHLRLGIGAGLVADEGRHQALHHDADVAVQRASDAGEAGQVQAVVTWWAGRQTESTVNQSVSGF